MIVLPLGSPVTTGLPAHNPCRVCEGCYSAALVFNLRCAGSQRSLQRGRIFRIAWRRKYLGSRREGCRHQRKGRCNEARACQHGRMQSVFRREHPQDRRGTELRNHLLGNQNLDAGRRTVRVERVGENLARDVKADAPIPCDQRVDDAREPGCFPTPVGTGFATAGRRAGHGASWLSREGVPTRPLISAEIF